MEKIITYNDIPYSKGESIYLRMETDPKLYLNLFRKGYKLCKHIFETDSDTIYITGRRQDNECQTIEEYRTKVDNQIRSSLKKEKITKPRTRKFRIFELFSHSYKLPFVLKNESQNGGREKFLIATEEDYEKLTRTVEILIDRNLFPLTPYEENDPKRRIDYKKYLQQNFKVQEYINTPSDFNTTIRLLTTSNYNLLYSVLKYKKPEPYVDETTLLGYFLNEVFHISSRSIVSNTLSGGKNILLDGQEHNDFESELLKQHDVTSEKFENLVHSTMKIHQKYKSELGIICGFDYIYDQDKQRWFLLEYHSRPMLGDYSTRQGLSYKDNDAKIEADGRIRATALKLALKR